MAALEPPPTPFTEYVLPAIIGGIAGLITATIGALAIILNGNRQREADRTNEQHRIEESRQGARREIDGRLQELAHHVAQLLEWGWGELAGTQSTLDRLQQIMASEIGPAALASDTLSLQIYAMLRTTHRSVQSLDALSSQHEEESVATGHDPLRLDRLHILSSSIFVPTQRALLKVLELTGDVESAEALRRAEVDYERRFREYSQLIAAHPMTAHPPSESDTSSS